MQLPDHFHPASRTAHPFQVGDRRGEQPDLGRFLRQSRSTICLRRRRKAPLEKTKPSPKRCASRAATPAPAPSVPRRHRNSRVTHARYSSGFDFRPSPSPSPSTIHPSPSSFILFSSSSFPCRSSFILILILHLSSGATLDRSSNCDRVIRARYTANAPRASCCARLLSLSCRCSGPALLFRHDPRDHHPA